MGDLIDLLGQVGYCNGSALCGILSSGDSDFFAIKTIDKFS